MSKLIVIIGITGNQVSLVSSRSCPSLIFVLGSFRRRCLPQGVRLEDPWNIPEPRQGQRLDRERGRNGQGRPERY